MWEHERAEDTAFAIHNRAQRDDTGDGGHCFPIPVSRTDLMALALTAIKDRGTNTTRDGGRLAGVKSEGEEEPCPQ